MRQARRRQGPAAVPPAPLCNKLPVPSVSRRAHLPYPTLSRSVHRREPAPATGVAGTMIATMEGPMDTTDVQRYARQLYDVRGAKAIAEAAQKALKFEHNNDRQQAE